MRRWHSPYPPSPRTAGPNADRGQGQGQGDAEQGRHAQAPAAGQDRAGRRADLAKTRATSGRSCKRARVLLGKGGLWNGAKHPKCTAATLNRRGLQACPKGSIFGKGYATGFADTVRTTPKITLVNGGAKEAYGFVQLTNPARVNAAVVGHIKKLHGKWAYQVDFTVPDVLQIVAGVPISLTKLHLTVGKGDIIASTYCPPDGRWKYDSTSWLEDGRMPHIAARVPCRR